jgi:hypothetical protein
MTDIPWSDVQELLKKNGATIEYLGPGQVPDGAGDTDVYLVTRSYGKFLRIKSEFNVSILRIAGEPTQFIDSQHFVKMVVALDLDGADVERLLGGDFSHIEKTNPDKVMKALALSKEWSGAMVREIGNPSGAPRLVALGRRSRADTEGMTWIEAEATVALSTGVTLDPRRVGGALFRAGESAAIVQAATGLDSDTVSLLYVESGQGSDPQIQLDPNQRLKRLSDCKTADELPSADSDLTSASMDELESYYTSSDEDPTEEDPTEDEWDLEKPGDFQKRLEAVGNILGKWTTGNFYFRPELADGRSPKPVIADGRHASYITDPYFVFVRSSDDGSVHLVSDGVLDLLVAPCDAANTFVLTPTNAQSGVARWTGTLVAQPFGNAFRVEGTPQDGELPPGDYVLMEKAGNSGQTEHLGSVFASAEAYFHQGMCLGFDVTQLTLEQPVASATRASIFKTPPGETNKYQKSGNIVAPYGWKFYANAQGWGDAQTQVISNERELQEAGKQTFGAEQGISYLGLTLGGGSSGETTTSLESIRQRKLTVTSHSYISADHAMTLDKSNVALADDFFKSVDKLLKGTMSFATFCKSDNFGSHFSNATTFGAKVYSVTRYTDDQIGTISDIGLDTKSMLDVGMQLKYAGVDIAGTKVSQSTEAANTYRDKWQRIFGAGEEFYDSVGRTSDGVHPDPTSCAPIMVELRPISDLLAPPFFRRWEIIGTHAGSLRSRLADYIRKNVFNVSGADGSEEARFYRLTYTSNKVAQNNSNMGEFNFAPVNSSDLGGKLSVEDTPGLAVFQIASKSGSRKRTLDLHQSMIVSGEELNFTLDLPIGKYFTLLDVLESNIIGYPFLAYPNNPDFIPAKEHYKETGFAPQLSFSCQPSSKDGNGWPGCAVTSTAAQVQIQVALPIFVCDNIRGGQGWMDGSPKAISGYANFTCEPIETAEALFG